MKFFIPYASDEAEGEGVYDAIRKFITEEMIADLSPRRIFSLKYRHDGKDYYAEVGGHDSRVHEPIIAILYDALRDLYYVCTPNRGVARGIPVLVGGNEVRHIVDFD